MGRGDSFLHNLKEKVKLVSFLTQEALSMLDNKIAKNCRPQVGSSIKYLLQNLTFHSTFHSDSTYLSQKACCPYYSFNLQFLDIPANPESLLNVKNK